MESEKLEAEREHLISEIERCQRAIEGGDSDPWWREDLGRFQHRLRCLDKPSAALTPPVDGGEFVMVPREADSLAAALVALTEANIYADVLELLTHGNPSRGIPPGALAKALKAASPSRPSPSLEQREVVRKALYEGLSWFGTLPEPEGDVPERYHRWDDLGEFAERILSALCDRGE